MEIIEKPEELQPFEQSPVTPKMDRMVPKPKILRGHNFWTIGSMGPKFCTQSFLEYYYFQL